MKTALLTFVLFFILCTSTDYPQVLPAQEPSAANREDIEKNYLIGLNSDALGLQVSSAYFLGEMKSQKALLPLMKMFREAKSDGIKLLAAWSLLKIGDSRGVYLVKREGEIGDCDNIRCILNFLYMDYCLKNNGKIDSN
jgi:hypothetical protein